MDKSTPLTAEELAALRGYAEKHGRTWKNTLRNAWMGNRPWDDAGVLRTLRNTRGPSWLIDFRFPKNGEAA